MSRKRAKPTKKANEKSDGFSVNVFRSDMMEDMQRDAIQVAKDAYIETKVQKDIAAKIKKHFDSQYPSSTWHCIVGNHFATSVTHATHYMLFFQLNGLSVLLFRSLD